MKKVPKKHNLTNRKGVWYYRRRVPKSAQAVFGEKPIQFSLKTKDFKVAASMRDDLDSKWTNRFDDAAKQSPDPVQAMAALSRHEALKIAREYVQEADLRFQQMDEKRGTVSKEVLQDIEFDLSLSEQALADISNPEGEEEVGRKVSELLEDNEIKLEAGDPVRGEFFEFMRRALLEIYRRAKARHKQDFSHPYIDELFAPSNANVGVTSPVISLSQVCDEFLADYKRVADAKNIRAKRRNDMRVGTDLILEVMGANTAISDVDREMCWAFMEVLEKLPPNRKKKFKDLPVDKVLTKAAKNGLAPMKWETQNSYHMTLVKVLDYACMEGYTDRNPAKVVKVLTDKRPDEDKRDPYTLDHLKTIFTAPIYVGCVNDERGYNTPGPNYPKRSRFWLPLIGLLTGMRMNEICQLNVDDVKCTEAETHYIHVFPSTKDQKVKNQSSRRKVPVHPILIRVGFLDYIGGLRAKGEGKVFPEIPVPKSGYRSDNFSKKYATFQKGVGIPKKTGVSPNERRYSFHSFRHNFRDELRRIAAPTEITELLGGWAPGNKAVNISYGLGYEPDQLFEYIKKITYPGLDLSHLYVKDDG